MIKYIALLITILILSLSTPILAAEPDNGTIEGKIVNGTEGGSSVSNQDITITTYLNNNEVASTTAKADAEGRFVFNGLSTDVGYSYQIMFVYLEVEYYSDWLDFENGETSKSTEVIIYETTTSDEAVKVMMAHTIMRIDEQGNLWITEYFLFVNESDRTYVGSTEVPALEKNETLRFILPEDASELQPELGLMECCIYGSEDGFVDTMPVIPGGREVIYSYKVDYNSGKYEFSRYVNYPTYNYDLLVQGEGTKLISDQLITKETLNIDGILFSHLSGAELARGDILSAKLSNLPETGNQGSIKWVSLTLLLLILGFSFAYIMRKRKLQPAKAEALPDNQRLLAEIAQLDDDLESGKIDESIYRKLRAEKKSQLVLLMQKAKGESGDR